MPPSRPQPRRAPRALLFATLFSLLVGGLPAPDGAGGLVREACAQINDGRVNPPARRNPPVRPAPNTSSRRSTRDDQYQSRRQPTPKPRDTNRDDDARDESTATSAKPSEGASSPGVSKKPSTRSSGASARKPVQPKRYDAKVTMPSLKFAPENVRGNLYFDPLDVIVEPGSTVELSVMLNNQSFRNVEGFDFTIVYDAEALQLQSWDLSPLTAGLGLERRHRQALRGLESTSIVPPGGAGAHLDVENQPGSLRLTVTLADPYGEERMTLAKLRFMAHPQPTGQTTVGFAPPSGTAAAVYARGDNILGTDDRMINGLLNANLFIRDASLLTQRDEEDDLDLETAMPGEMPDEHRSAYGWSVEPPKSLREAEVELRLQAPELAEVRTGDEFWVDLVLINDARVLVHGIGAAVRFDPTRLQVVDQDLGNWIHRGDNIWDGAFHDLYPFDFHGANFADNKAGLIVYHNARHYREYAFPTGVFARIRFRALAPADPTSIRIVRTIHEGRPGTFVRAYGLDLLDNTWDPARPPQAAMRVLATETADADAAIGAP